MVISASFSQNPARYQVLDSLIEKSTYLSNNQQKLQVLQLIVEAASTQKIKLAVNYLDSVFQLTEELYPIDFSHNKHDALATKSTISTPEERHQYIVKQYAAGNYIESEYLGDSLIETFEQDSITTDFQAEVYRQLAFSKNVLSKFDESIVIFSHLLSYYTRQDNQRLIARTYVDFVEYYRSTYNYQLGFEYVYKARAILANLLAEKELACRLLGREAALYAEGERDTPKTIELSSKALLIANSLGNEELIASSSNELGAAFDNNISALPHYLRAIVLWQKRGEVTSMNIAKLNLSRTLLNMNFKKEAISGAVQVLKESERFNWLPLQWMTHEFLAEAYTKAGLWDKASHEMKQALRTATLLEKNRHSKQLNIELTKHETNLAKNEIDLHKKEIVNVKFQLENEKLQGNILALGVIAIVIILLILFVGYNKIKSVNKELNKTLTQREVLLKEVHHRVKNSLQIISSLLNLQSTNLKDSAALYAIKEGQSRVKTIALIHQKLYQTDDFSSIDLNEYISQLCDLIASTYKLPDKNIQTFIDVEDLFLEIDKAVPLGLIINEAVSNAYKYAFENDDKGTITIRLQQIASNKLELIIQDNGIGIAPEHTVDNPSTLGIKLISILSKQLKGQVSYSAIKGTSVLVTFPRV